MKHHVSTWLNDRRYFCEQCVLRDRWFSLFPRSLLLSWGLFSPSLSSPLSLYPSLRGLPLQILSHLCISGNTVVLSDIQTYKTVHALLICTYPRTCILGCDLFQRFERQSSTHSEISIWGSSTLPTARQTHGCNEHTACARMLIFYSWTRFSFVAHMRRDIGECGVTAVTGFAQITGSL